MLITGTRKGIGKELVYYYIEKGWEVIGCSRGTADYKMDGYTHFEADVSDENAVSDIFKFIKDL